MANRTTLPGQIIGSFEDIGKDVVKQTTKLPSDIAGVALESLGSSTQKGTAGQQLVGQFDATAKKDTKNDQWDQIDQVKEGKIKQAVARAALEALTARKKSKEPSVWGRLQKEADQKKEQQNALATQQAQQVLPKMSSKNPPGDLYGLRAKRSSAEIGKNVKSD